MLSRSDSLANDGRESIAWQADASRRPSDATKLAIRCLPRVPVAASDVEQWLERQLEEFRHHRGQATLRLSRLTQTGPDTDIAIGWLIELELPGDRPVAAWDHIASMLGDLRLLGLQPTVLVPTTGVLTSTHRG